MIVHKQIVFTKVFYFILFIECLMKLEHKETSFFVCWIQLQYLITWD